MGWNGSENKNAAPVPKKTAKAPPSKWRGLIALAVIVVGGLAAWFALRPAAPADAENGERGTTHSSLITSQAPQLATNKVAQSEKKVREKPREIPFWERPTPEGLTEMEALKWKHHHTVVSTTNDVSRYREKPRYKVFDNDFDNRLGCYLTMEAGRGMVGTTVFDDRLREEFEASLQQPIVIDANDDEYTKELKKLVRESKIELANRVRAGEDICEIMQGAHDELIRLATLKRDIEGEFAKFARDENNSIEDVEDCLKAANLMLEDRGIAPLKASPLLKEAIRLAAVEAGKKPADDDDGDDDEEN